MVNILLGAILGFASAFTIAAWVAPQVQAGIRRRERWEKAVDEAFLLIDELLDDALDEFRAKCDLLRRVEGMAKTGSSSPELLREAYASARAAQTKVGNLSVRYRRLERRLKRMRRDSPYWSRLGLQSAGFRLSVSTAQTQFAIAEVMRELGGESPTDWLKEVDRLQKERAELAVVLREIADGMTLPPKN